MSHNTIQIKPAVQGKINHGFCEVLVREVPKIQRPDGNDGVDVLFRPNGERLLREPFVMFYSNREDEEHHGIGKPEVVAIMLELSVNDAEALIEMLLSYPKVREAREKRSETAKNTCLISEVAK